MNYDLSERPIILRPRSALQSSASSPRRRRRPGSGTGPADGRGLNRRPGSGPGILGGRRSTCRGGGGRSRGRGTCGEPRDESPGCPPKGGRARSVGPRVRTCEPVDRQKGLVGRVVGQGSSLNRVRPGFNLSAFPEPRENKATPNPLRAKFLGRRTRNAVHVGANPSAGSRCPDGVADASDPPKVWALVRIQVGILTVLGVWWMHATLRRS
jgi:hypothetical protein